MEEDSNSFQAAADTQYQAMIEAGYDESDILLKKAGTEDEFFNAIAGSEDGEIEQILVFSHGWNIDYNGENNGGLQLTPYESEDYIDEYDLNHEDLTSDVLDLSSKFSDDASITLNACNVGNSTFPQELADTLGVDVYAYTKPMKFYTNQNVSAPGVISYPFPYNGDGKSTHDNNVYMRADQITIPGINMSFSLFPVLPKKFEPTVP